MINPTLQKKTFLLLIGRVALWPIIPQHLTATDNRIKSLNQPFKDWLDLAAYIITTTEKEIFLEFRSEGERNTFINIFWKQRDPNRGTPENEFKDEHSKRFKYANRYFGYIATVLGWETDRGRIHIILGLAIARDEINSNGLYPIEIWDYQGNPAQSLPTMFSVVFYKQRGSGDYVEARKVLKTSLRINGNQVEITKILNDIQSR